MLAAGLPVEDYLQDAAKRAGRGRPEVRDLGSLRVLLPTSQRHLLPPGAEAGPEQDTGDKPSPIRQVRYTAIQQSRAQTPAAVWCGVVQHGAVVSWSLQLWSPNLF